MSKQGTLTAGCMLCVLTVATVVAVKLAGGGPEKVRASSPGAGAAVHRGAGGTGTFGEIPAGADAGPRPDAGPAVLAPATGPAPSPDAVSGSVATTAPTMRPATPDAAAAPDGQGLFDRDRLTGDWFGFRPKLEDRGVTLNSTIEGDVGRTLSGGLDTASGAGSYIYNLTVSLDTAKLGLWTGGTFFTDFRAEDGKSRSLDGAFQVTSRACQPRRTQVSELWYEQKLLGDKVRLKAGKIDANVEFAHADNAADFVNSAMSYSPTIQDFPTDPDPATGLVAFVYPTDHLYLGYGVFDGALHNKVATGSRGPATLWGPPGDWFMIGEAGVKWTAAGFGDGRLGVGGWGQTGTFQRADGGVERGTAGGYLTCDQVLLRTHPEKDDDNRGVAAFVLLGEADPAVSAAAYHAAGGLTWTGPLPTRDADVLGLGATWVRFGDEPAPAPGRDDEVAVECFYKVQVAPWLTCKPDLAFVHNPGGAAGVADAVAGSVQFIAAL
jgi:porin